MNFKYFKTELLLILILVLVVVYTGLCHVVMAKLKISSTATEINENVHIISTLSLLSLTIFFINHIGWKWWLFKWLIDIPNLNGRYTGKLVSSYKDANGKPTEKICVIEIKQTASEIHLFAYFGDTATNEQTSASSGVSEEIIQEKNGLFKLYYVFNNESGTLQSQLDNHTGTAWFKYFPDKQALEGEYYNKENHGEIKVMFRQKRILGRLIR